MASCIFCKIIAGDIPSKRVFEDDQCIALRDINPIAPTHLLVVPKRHIETMNDLQQADELLAGHLLRIGAQLAHTERIDGSGYRLVFNTNRDAGQTVFHIHLHVMGGRSMEWPPG
jgi:histidine triad (HIT) family protein